ncbi:MAG: hypothetical protein R2736_06155 [Solirubrobacterales bacterium]
MTGEEDPQRRPDEPGEARPYDQEPLERPTDTIEPLPSEREERFEPAPAEAERPQGMIPGRERRRTKVERGFMRLIATGGIVGIATALGAILVSQDVAGWIVGLAVGLTSVVLAALLWSSRQL